MRPFLSRSNKADTACQVMKPDMMSKIFLDLDDNGCPTLAEAQAKTQKMIEWRDDDWRGAMTLPAAAQL